MGVKITRKGAHRLYGPDGALISTHSDPDEALERASFLPPGIYTLVPAQKELRVYASGGGVVVDKETPGVKLVGTGELLAGQGGAINPQPSPEPAPGDGPLAYLASFPTPTLTDPHSGKTAKLNYGKHTKIAYCQLTGDLYFVGGDGQGQHWGGNDSGALDTVGRYHVESHAYASDFLYQGAVGEVVPRGLDFIGFTWVPTLGEFWLGPGWGWDYGPEKYPWRDFAWSIKKNYASYNPLTKKFTDRGPRQGRAYVEGFAGSWDSKRGRIVWVENDLFHSLDPATGQIQSTGWVGLPSSHRTETADTHYDETTDELVFAQIPTGRVYAYRIGDKKLRLVADVGCTAESSASYAVVFPPGHCLITYSRETNRANPWRLVNLATGEVKAMDLYPEGCTAFNTGCYHPPTGQIVFTGGSNDETPTGLNMRNGAAYHHYQWNGAGEVAVQDPKDEDVATPTNDTYSTESGGDIKGGLWPAWREGLAVNEWRQIANTAAQTFVNASPLYTALRTYHEGTMLSAYSGMAVRQASAELLFGAPGGGAGAHAGSDIIGLNLLADVPAWVCHVPPAAPEYVWPAGTPGNQTFTVNVGTSTLTVGAVKNGFQNGESFSFPVGTPPAPLQVGTTYWVVNASGYAPVTFQVSATQGGAPITLTDAGDAAARILWVRTSHGWTKNDKPNARHAYNQPHHIAQTDELILIGCRNVWETDSGLFNPCYSWQVGNADWDAQGRYPNAWTGGGPGYDGNWQAEDPSTGTVYYGLGTQMGKRLSDGTVSQFAYSPSVGNHRDKAKALFDPSRGTIIWHGEAGTSGVFEWWEITPAGAHTTLTLTGPAAASITNSNGAGFTRDTVTGAYYLYQDDGNLYKITWSGSNLYAEQVTTTGTAPIAGDGAASGAIWSRLRYLEKLGGIALITKATASVYFLRTH